MYKHSNAICKPKVIDIMILLIIWLFLCINHDLILMSYLDYRSSSKDYYKWVEFQIYLLFH